MTNSKKKGARGEREFCHFLKEELQIKARRGQQYSGNPEAPDVVTSLDGVHFEVKRTETLSLYKAMEQAIGDSGENIPVVAHKRNRKEWLIIVQGKDLEKLSNCIINRVKNETTTT